jgi:hypothetical protein
MQNAITIGRVAKVAGCKVQTIRYYEQIGLLLSFPIQNDNYRLKMSSTRTYFITFQYLKN